jgi:hypothetical protein
MAYKQPQWDNSTFFHKLKLRRSALAKLDGGAVVMETNGGEGKIYNQLYRDFDGIVFEKKPDKVDVLAQQRPHWRVYEADCVYGIRSGLGADMPINFLDVDPYGEPWSILDAFFESDRARSPLLQVVVNDGVTQMLQTKTAWTAKVFESVVERFGNDFYREYEGICQILMQEKAAQCGYRLSRWYITKVKTTGVLHNYHYWAALER